MKIIKETSRVVGRVEGYNGVCNACGAPLEYDEPLIVVEVENREDRIVLVPIDMLSCPSCNKGIILINVWKNLEVSKELKELSK